MNLQTATSNPSLPHAAQKAAAGTTGSSSAATSDASGGIDFAALLASSLPPGSCMPTKDSLVPVKDEKSTDDVDAASANPVNAAIAIEPQTGAAVALAANTSAAVTATDASRTAIGIADQLRATNPSLLGIPSLVAAAKPTPARTDPDAIASRSDFAQLPDATLPAAAALTTALSEAATSAEMQKPALAGNIDGITPQPDRGGSVGTQPPSNIVAPTPLRLEIQTPITASGWDQQLGQQVVWMSNQHNQTAELRINPPDLGPVEMRLTLDQGGQQATLHFASPHAEVRDTIENAMPRLREMMADAGIALGNATVGGDSLPPQTTPEQNRPAPQTFRQAATLENAPGDPSRITARRGNGLVDTFA